MALMAKDLISLNVVGVADLFISNRLRKVNPLSVPVVSLHRVAAEGLQFLQSRRCRHSDSSVFRLRLAKYHL